MTEEQIDRLKEIYADILESVNVLAKLIDTDDHSVFDSLEELRNDMYSMAIFIRDVRTECKTQAAAADNQIEFQALIAEREGMKAQNDDRISRGERIAYGDDMFNEIAELMRNLKEGK